MANGNSLGPCGSNAAGDEVLMPWWLRALVVPRPNGAIR